MLKGYCWLLGPRSPVPHTDIALKRAFDPRILVCQMIDYSLTCHSSTAALKDRDKQSELGARKPNLAMSVRYIFSW